MCLGSHSCTFRFHSLESCVQTSDIYLINEAFFYSNLWVELWIVRLVSRSITEGPLYYLIIPFVVEQGKKNTSHILNSHLGDENKLRHVAMVAPSRWYLFIHSFYIWSPVIIAWTPLVYCWNVFFFKTGDSVIAKQWAFRIHSMLFHNDDVLDRKSHLLSVKDSLWNDSFQRNMK